MENIIFLDIDGVLNNIEVKFKEESVNVIKELIKQYRELGYYEQVTNNLVKVLKKKYKQDIK